MKIITSTKNQQFQDLLNIKDRKVRTSDPLIWIEGIRFVKEALDHHVEMLSLVISETFLKSKAFVQFENTFEQLSLQGIQVSDHLFARLSDTKSPQGVGAVVKLENLSMNEIGNKSQSLLLVLDGISDPGNMGTIIRTAEASGVLGIILLEGCVDINNPKVLRATMGSIFRVPIRKEEDGPIFIQHLKQKGFSIFSASGNGEKTLYQTNFGDKCAVIIGNEAKGIRKEILEISDAGIQIPMEGKTESLNAAVATAVILYEAYRMRKHLRQSST